MRKSYTVSTETKSMFIQKAEKLQKDLLVFVAGKGELPLYNLEVLRKDVINHSVKEMTQTGCGRAMAKRISTNVINDLMYEITGDGMAKALEY